MKIFKEFKKCLVTLITFSSSFPYLIYFKYIKDILIYYVYYILFIEKKSKKDNFFFCFVLCWLAVFCDCTCRTLPQRKCNLKTKYIEKKLNFLYLKFDGTNRFNKKMET